MSSGDKMAPFLASEMACVCHVIFFNYVYIYKNYSNSERLRGFGNRQTDSQMDGHLRVAFAT